MKQKTPVMSYNNITLIASYYVKLTTKLVVSYITITEQYSFPTSTTVSERAAGEC